MHISLLLGCFLLTASEYFLGYAHMIPDERLSTNRVAASNALSQNLEIDSPPVVIVELPKSAKKSKKTKKQKKGQGQDSRSSEQNKYGVKKRPPPPANCISLWGSCKSPGTVCCDYCAFCQCRLFRTVCFCRMGNPRC